jgi:hypothetical protein
MSTRQQIPRSTAVTNAGGVGLTGMIILGLGLLFGFVTFVLVCTYLPWINTNTGLGTQDTMGCNSFSACHTSKRLADGSCVTPPRMLADGTDCTETDQCYHRRHGHRQASEEEHREHTKRCCNGVCVGERRDCKGFCEDNTPCQENPLPLRTRDMLDVSVDSFCFAESCITVVVGGYTSDCLSWIDTGCYPHHRDYNATRRQCNNFVASCLYTRYDNMGGQFPPGVCYYRYSCAPLSFDSDDLRRDEPQTDAPTTLPALPGPLNLQFGSDPMNNEQYQLIKARVEKSIAGMLNAK